MNRLYVESDGDHVPREVYICEDEGSRVATMDDVCEKICKARAQEICDAVNERPAMLEVQRCLEIMTGLVGHNSCTDGRTPNGFAVALDQARAILKQRGIKDP